MATIVVPGFNNLFPCVTPESDTMACGYCRFLLDCGIG